MIYNDERVCFLSLYFNFVILTKLELVSAFVLSVVNHQPICHCTIIPAIVIYKFIGINRLL